MRNNLGSALGLLLAIVSNGGTMAQTYTPEQTIWSLPQIPRLPFTARGF
jgi:hypothetical protein